MLHGRVTAKADGSAVSGARVRLSSGGTDLIANCDPDGRYELSNLQPDLPYSLVIEAIGFERLTRVQVTWKSGDNPFDATLKIDPLQENVTVFAGAPEIKTTPEISTAIDSRTLITLPSNTRDLPHFALLDPRARNTSGVGSDGRQATRLAINNQSFRHTQYTLDGSTNYDFIFANGPQQNVSLAALGEVKLLTNNYTAEYGRSSGGNLIASTKAGTDQYHGEAFFFLRPSGIQATPPVSTFRVPNEREDWGAAVGGPLVANHTYFFGSYEGVHQERGSFIQSPVANFFVGTQNSWTALARVDQRWNDREFTSLRINSDHFLTNNLNDNVGGFVQPNGAVNDWQQSAAAQLTQRSLFGSWLNDFRLSYTNAIPLSDSAVQPGLVIVRPSYSTTGSSQYQNVRTNTYQAADTIEKNWGRHSFRFGGDYIRQVANDRTVTPFGTYTFAPGAPVAGQQPLQYSQTFGISALSYGQALASAFFNDSWKISSRLTANLGLRYEYQSTVHDLNNFAPRLGLAWDPTGSGKTVIRAGAGIFYDQVYEQIIRNYFNQGPGSATATYTLSAGTPGFPVFPNILAAPPLGARTPRDIYLINPNLRTPYALEFSLGVQRSLPGGLLLSVDGTHLGARKQIREGNLNAPQPFLRTAAGQTRSAANANATRQFKTYYDVAANNVAEIESDGSARNSALSVALSRRFAGRYEFQGSYLYSSQMTNTFFTGGLNTGTPGTWNISNGETAPADFFQRHRFVASGVADLPYRIRLSGMVVAASGLPVNPLTGVDNDGDGILADRPYGFARNSFRGPYQSSIDIAVARTFRLREFLSVELRAEGYNLLNRSNFLKLNATYGNLAAPAARFLTPTAGIANSDPARQFQFAARFLF